MVDAANNTTSGRRPGTAAIYGVLALIMILTAALSLWISAPAWRPGAPGLHQPERWDELASSTRQLYQRQRQRLERYEWRDREARQVAIPIERAMELMTLHATDGQEIRP
jgi:hypothetical protein